MCGGPPVISVVTDDPGVRTATVSYTATSKNLFSTILGKANLAIGGTSSAVASQAPSINFYVALDTSPSMLLPTTTSGITNLNAGARWNGEYYYYSRWMAAILPATPTTCSSGTWAPT
jgi:hypothetical protein